MANRLLSKLNEVRQTGRGTYLALCPAHNDREPSLSICETEGGTVLVHCFAGCSAHEVLDAVNLDLSDLFPPRQHHGKPGHRPFPAADALRAVAFESLVVAAAASVLLCDQSLTAADQERLMLAVERIQAAASAVLPQMKGGAHV